MRAWFNGTASSISTLGLRRCFLVENFDSVFVGILVSHLCLIFFDNEIA